MSLPRRSRRSGAQRAQPPPAACGDFPQSRPHAGHHAARAYALDDHAYALVSGVRDDGFDLRALIVPPPQQRMGWGRRMIDALAALHAGKACNVAPIVPEGLMDPFFQATGFVRQSINQVELGLTL